MAYPSADFGTAAARERIVAAIAPGYRGERHLLGALLLAALYIGMAASFLRDVRPWEWLLIPATLVFANGVEWLVHRGPLHHPYHLPADHTVARLGLVGWLRRQHQRHHDPQRMTEGNFNVSIPLFDWVMGTRLR